ncbi:hypothetical protein ANCCAN_26602 [Ancylostoma caninum]|uniref:Uncharacterized protein n=1 Tax=Ancylostoma caninum TaxID=29170 RepID=A0A368F6F5_ANCCA|nr:hypothetical protein ANCCAN_26602 [Ancylostoma caninum]
MVHSFPSYGNCTEAVLDSGQCCDEVNGCESEATSSAGPIPTVELANGVEMPLLGLEKESVDETTIYSVTSFE